ncbi:FYVE, RhoGEF and PH domain-containing protein 4-like isoform X4 [Lineus longissimus]|uniref:FYVE, RhoGEF and PH domain-containing protein 4-like isoform X4 n=1 Tax=Lineus longissimus TaxID=88925 RepID=UPI00315D9768
MAKKQSSFKSYVSESAKEHFEGGRHTTNVRQKNKKTGSSTLTHNQSEREHTKVHPGKDPDAKNEDYGKVEENVGPVPVPSPRTARTKPKRTMSEKTSFSRPAKPPPPVPAKTPGGRRGLNRSQTQSSKELNSVVNRDADSTPEFLRVQLKPTGTADKPRQSYTTDDVDDIKRLSKEAIPTPPIRRKNYPGGSGPSSAQSSPKPGQRSKRISYTTDDLDKMSETRSVDGDLKKGGSIKPKVLKFLLLFALPKPRFIRRTNRERTPERDSNHRVDSSDSKSGQKSKPHRYKKNSEDSVSPLTKLRSKSLTHKAVSEDSDKTHQPLQKTTNICDTDTSSCDSENSAIKLRSDSDPVKNTTIPDSFVPRNHIYDEVCVENAEAKEGADDGTPTKEKTMRLLEDWNLDIRVHLSDEDTRTGETETLKQDPNHLEVGANHDDDGAFSTHEYSSFDSDSFGSDSDSDNTDLNNASANMSAVQQVLQDMEEECAGMDPLRRKAHEVLVTERVYVKKLQLIDQTFQFRIEMENKKHNMFPDEVINQMFANIKSIYQLHSEHLLPKLEQRMKNWETEGRIGDILVTFAPFLKMYSEYVKNYDTGTTLITNWCQKCPRFKAIIDELQSLPECGHLALQHHMLNPIQRVPRYELLLKDYLKLLPEDSDDRELTEKALNVVTTAACHSNEAMKKIDKFRKVLDVHDKIGGSVTDLVSPTRELIKEGKVMKVSRRKGALLERYLFLFNDLLLVCEQGINLIRASYSVRDKLSIDGMKIFEGDNQEIKYTFRVKSKEKVLEFSASGLEEKDEWQAKLWNVVQDFSKKKSSLKPDERLYDTGISEDKIGMEAPVWVRDNSASMCMVCSLEFKAFRRRHHCRACGILVCNRCSDFRTKLEFDEKMHRVCKRCHDIIVAKGVSYSGGEGVEITSGGTPQKVKPGILQIKGDDPSVMSGSLKVSMDGGKTWNKRWFAVHTDFVLYSFKARRDVAATSTTPLPGFQVKDVDEADDITEPNVFKLCHTHLTYFYQAPTVSAKTRWMDVLTRVVKAEIPSIYMNNPDQSEPGLELSDNENNSEPAD